MTPYDALIASSNQQSSLLDQKAAAILAAMWARLPDYSNRGMEQFLRDFVPYLIATQGAVAALTSAYLTAVISQATGKPLSPVGVPSEMVSGAAIRNGVGPGTVYQRPFETVWWELSQGTSYEAAIQRGLDRALTIAQTDIELAKTHSARYVLERVGPETGVVGYQRVITNPKACELCRIAATQRYHKQDLLPIHMNCTCGIAPLFGGPDWQGRAGARGGHHVIDTGFVHPEAESPGFNFPNEERAAGREWALKGVPGFDAHFINNQEPQVQVAVHEHGEIGPVLTVKGQHFKGPDQIPPTAETAAH